MKSLPCSILCAFTAVALCLGCRSQVATKEDATQPVRVKLVAAYQAEVQQTTRQPATILPFFETEMRSRVSGYVASIEADIGEHVEAGRVLATIAIPEVQQQRKTLATKVTLLQAQEKEAEAGESLAEATVQSFKARLEQSKSLLGEKLAALEAFQAEFARTEDLVSRGSLQSRMLDEARKRRDSAVAARDAVLSSVRSAEAEVGVAQAQLAAAIANRQIASAETEVAIQQLRELEILNEFAKIRAPFAGVVTQRMVNHGDLVDGDSQHGSSPLFVVSQVDQLRVHVPVPEVDAPFVSVGDTLHLTLPSYANEPPITVTVSRRSESLDPNSRTMLVEALLENPNGKFLPGMFGEASIDLGTQVARTLLPSRAVRFDEQGSAYVYLVDASNQISVAEVTTGLDTGSEIEIRAGLDAGQMVVGAHLKRFVDGQIVSPL